MKNKGLVVMATAVFLCGWQAGAWGTDPVATGRSFTEQNQEVVYGRQLMTPEELTAHRAKMRSLATEKEREQYRLEHHKLMQERARERGLTLPDEPGPMGKGMGSGGGMGAGGGEWGPVVAWVVADRRSLLI